MMTSRISQLLCALYFLVVQLSYILALTTTDTTSGNESPSTQASTASTEAPGLETSETGITTVADPATSTEPPQGRSFDGVSFIGGIVFASFMIVIGLVLYYRCRKKKEHENYRVF